MARPQVFISSRHEEIGEAIEDQDEREMERRLALRENAERNRLERVEADSRRGRWLPPGDLDAAIVEVQDESAERIKELQADLEQIQARLEQNEFAMLTRQLKETREELDQVRRLSTTRQDRLFRYFVESQNIAAYAKERRISFEQAVAEAQKTPTRTYQ